MQKQSHHHAATKDDWTIEWTEEAIDAVQACIWLHVHSIPLPRCASSIWYFFSPAFWDYYSSHFPPETNE